MLIISKACTSDWTNFIIFPFVCAVDLLLVFKAFSVTMKELVRSSLKPFLLLPLDTNGTIF